MNIFVIHSGCDREEVFKKIVEPVKQKEPRAHFLLLENGGALWKVGALRAICNAQLVLFVIGKESCLSTNIGWEINTALHKQKSLGFIKLSPDFKEHPNLYQKNPYTQQKELIAHQFDTIDLLSESITSYENGMYKLFNYDISLCNETQLLEQYKLFFTSSESLVSRRQAVNNFYLTANTAIIAAIASVLALKNVQFEKSFFIGILSIAGIVLDFSWLHILESYGTLNSSKIKILNIIESKLPLSIYDAEWQAMSDSLNKKKYISFTSHEKLIPRIFIFLYVLFILMSIYLLFG